MGVGRHGRPRWSGIGPEVVQGKGDLMLAHAAVVRGCRAGAGIIEDVACLQVEVDADRVIATVGCGNAPVEPKPPSVSVAAITEPPRASLSARP